MTPAEREAEAARDALIARCEAGLSREAEEKRDAVIAELERRADRAKRTAWARGVEIKGPNSDTVHAVLARLGVVDRQGDIVDPGCLLNPPGDRVPVSSWDHDYLHNRDAPAVGFATVSQQGGELRAFVTYNDTPEGRAAARRVHDQLPDWSWGLSSIQTRPLTDSEIRAGAIRAIHKVLIVEVSPVSRAASIASGTLSCDCASCSVAGADGKCSHGDGAIPPCHPRRRAWDAEVERLLAHAAPKDDAVWEPNDARRARLDDLVAGLLEHEGLTEEDDVFGSFWSPPWTPERDFPQRWNGY